MKPILAALLLSTTVAAGAAFAAGPTMPPATTPTDTDTTTTPSKPSDTTMPDTTKPSSTNMDTNRTSHSSSHHRSAMHSASMHSGYSQQCSDLRAQWQDASERKMHNRHFKSAKHQAMLGERSCRSHKTGLLKSGVVHLKSALRMIGEKPSI